jgi:hypothetical protein
MGSRKIHVTIHGIAEVPDDIRLSNLVAISKRLSRGAAKDVQQREIAVKDETTGSVFRVIPSVTYIEEWDTEFPPLKEIPDVEEA